MFFKAVEVSPLLVPVRTFANTHYPSLILTPSMLEQLLWLQTNTVITSQSNIHLKPDPVNIEVKRVLSRLYSVKLLKEGGALAYSTFVQSQTTAILSEDNFNRLSRFIQELTPAAYECLITTCFIAKSEQAIMAVPEERRRELPDDSEQFVTHMVTQFPRLLPICASLDQEVVNLLPYAFYKNSHVRHMLDMEGGYNMLWDLKSAMYPPRITLEQYNLWFARWIINIAGLDGHVNYFGSIYLTEPVANCIWALKQELDQLWSNPYHNVIGNYLSFRKEQLEVNDEYIAYLGAIMRQYSPSIGREIQTWFASLSEREQQEKKHVFELQLGKTRITPAYKPTVLINLLQLGCSVSDTLTIFTEIESQAITLYTDAIATDHVSEKVPFSYRNIAMKESLASIKNYYDENHCLPKLSMSYLGYLILTEEALRKRNVLG